MKIISIVNMKGGVGKTTLAVNLADCLSRRSGKQVLLVDMDPQFNATQSIFSGEDYMSMIGDGHNTIIDIFSDEPISSASTVGGKKVKEPLELSDIQPTEFRERFDILMGSLELYRIDMSGGSGRELRLKRLLELWEENYSYDYVIIDTPPTPSAWLASALIASSFYLVPVKPEPLSVTGMDLLKGVVSKHIKNHALSLKCAGLVLTIAEPQTIVYRDAKAFIKGNDFWGKYLFDAEIPKRTSIARSTGDQGFLLDSSDMALRQGIVKVAHELQRQVGDAE